MAGSGVSENDTEKLMLDRLYAAVLAVAGLGYGGYILLDELTGGSDTPGEDEHHLDEVTPERVSTV
ncbi:hypothetical membrane protein [Rhodococcus opacus B4]|uniref:Hypothetical membrane protein n=2 Tax=Rhodococcus opacus TaxID=37919 RepID=C1B5F0_RHOOB|nr:hypothetical membrane protein [Rhodococcus opacus B4]